MIKRTISAKLRNRGMNTFSSYEIHTNIRNNAETTRKKEKSESRAQRRAVWGRGAPAIYRAQTSPGKRKRRARSMRSVSAHRQCRRCSVGPENPLIVFAFLVMAAQEQKQHGEWSEKIKVEKSVCKAVVPTKCSKLTAKMKNSGHN